MRQNFAAGKTVGSICKYVNPNDAAIKGCAVLLTACFVLSFCSPWDETTAPASSHDSASRHSPLSPPMPSPSPVMESSQRSQAKLELELGNDAAASSNFNQAVQHFKKATELQPDYALAYGDLAAAYSVTRQWRKAIEAYSSSLKLNPLDADAYTNLGFLHVEMAQTEQATSRRTPHYPTRESETAPTPQGPTHPVLRSAGKERARGCAKFASEWGHALPRCPLCGESKSDGLAASLAIQTSPAARGGGTDPESLASPPRRPREWPARCGRTGPASGATRPHYVSIFAPDRGDKGSHRPWHAPGSKDNGPIGRGGVFTGPEEGDLDPTSLRSHPAEIQAR